MSGEFETGPEFKRLWRERMFAGLRQTSDKPDAELWSAVDWLWTEARRIGRELRDQHDTH